MRILHTSDLHIGKRLENKIRLDEQKAVLDEIVQICNDEKVQLVLISGDVYDTFTPSAEAEGLFFDTISKLSNGERIVIIVSGNHDDYQRLNASKMISSNSDVYFADGKIESFNTNKLKSNIKMEKVGTNNFVVSDDFERLFIGALSYPTELRLKEKIDQEETYSDKMKRWIDACFLDNTEKLPQIFVSHLFMLGGVKTDGERSIELGGARIIDKSLIPDSCIYTALGHLHKRQVIDKDKNIIYSGSILQYSFDETNTEKSVTVFDVIGGKVENLHAVKLEKGKQLFRVKAKNLVQAQQLISNLDGYVELTLELDKPLDATEHKLFSQAFPNVIFRLSFLGNQEYLSARRNLSDKEVFVEYYKTKYNATPSNELVDAFLDMLAKIEVGDETN